MKMLASTDTIVFAKERFTGQAKHVREVPTGRACNCVCPGCGELLDAVNAQATHYKKRPHFRHVEHSEQPGCADVALWAALRESAPAMEAVVLPPADPVVVALFPDIASSAATSMAIEGFEVVDHTTALLRFPNGRTIRVALAARSWGDGVNPPGFDLVVTLPGEDTDIESIDDLTRYLTLDSSHWRWCARQTAPSPLDVAPPFELVSESAGEGSQPAEPLAVEPIAIDSDAGVAPIAGQAITALTGPQPIRRWTETVMLPGVGKTLFHCTLWPNGVVTEERERG